MIAKEVEKLEQENIELKEQLKKMEELYGDTHKLPKNCEYCSNFIQHYVRCAGNLYVPTCDGHCTAGNRIKSKRGDDSCKSFVLKKYGKNCI